MFLAREGISYAMLKDMETEADHEENAAIALEEEREAQASAKAS